MKSKQLLESAKQLYINKKYPEALNTLFEILKNDSKNFQALHLAAVIESNAGNKDQSFVLFETAFQISQDDESFLKNYFSFLLQVEQFERAKTILLSMTKKISDEKYIKFSEAKLLCLSGHVKQGVLVLKNLHDQYAQDFDLTWEVGYFLFQISNFASAMEFLSAIPLSSKHLQGAKKILGRIHAQQHRYENAFDEFSVVLQMNSNDHEALLSCGICKLMLGNANDAINYFDLCDRLNPRDEIVLFNRALAYRKLDMVSKAIDDFQKVLSVNSQHLQAWINLGSIYKDQHQFERVKELVINHVLSLDPRHREGLMLLAHAERELLNVDKAIDAYEELQQSYPNDLLLQWMKIFSKFPVIASSQNQLNESIDEFGKDMCDFEVRLEEELKSLTLDASTLVGAMHPYYLAYHESDHSQVMSIYGDVCCKIMQNHFGHYTVKNQPNQTPEKIKIGFVSEQIRYHSVWNAITKGLVENINASQFEIHVFSLSQTVDLQTQIAKSCAHRFHSGPKTLEQWADCISDSDLHFLIYPEIGLSTLTSKLASLKLAHRQVAFWGHPMTTGLPSIDFYVSSQAFENKNSDNQYCEKLVQLPGLGCHYSPLNLDEEHFDLNSFLSYPGKPILISPGNLYKYQPQHDRIWLEIIEQVGDCNLLFFYKNAAWKNAFEMRLKKLSDELGIALKGKVIFLPWVNPAQFKSILQQSSIFLDSIGFSGFNTVMQAVEVDLPIVSKQGLFMRGSFGSGILSEMGLEKWIARDKEEYVGRAVKLAKDANVRDEYAFLISHHKNKIFNDSKPVQAFEKFLLESMTL